MTPPDPPGDRPARAPALDPAALRSVAAVAAVALVLAVVWWWSGRAEPVTATRPAAPAASTTVLPPASPVSGSPAVASASPASGSATVMVDIRGAVRSPGVHEVPAGARVIDAVAAAGGLVRGRRGYGTVNLARPVVDGEQIVVGRSARAAPAPGATGATTAPVDGEQIDLNTADAAALETLDGVGPVLAARIVEWREANGPFTAVEDLLDVSGIGETTLAGFRDSVTVR